MTRIISILLIVLSLALLMISCGQNKSSDSGFSQYFPDHIEAVAASRQSDVTLYVGDSLWEYIDGGAELYHSYGFVQVATADYKAGDNDYVADIYEFETPTGAYGMLTAIRPDEPEIPNTNLPGYISSTNINLVKGKYLVRVTTFTSSEEIKQTLLGMAVELADKLSGPVGPPQEFALFPSDNRVPYTDKYSASDYMGYTGLDGVYTDQYEINGERFTLLMADDPDGEKLAIFKTAYATQTKKSADKWFPGGGGFMVSDDFEGDVIVGRVGNKMVGILNFLPGTEDFFISWLNNLSQ